MERLQNILVEELMLSLGIDVYYYFYTQSGKVKSHDVSRILYTLTMDYLNRPDVVRILLKHGADPNYIPYGGWTCLHDATECNYVETAHLLIQYGANMYAKSYGGEMCSLYANVSNQMMDVYLYHGCTWSLMCEYSKTKLSLVALVQILPTDIVRILKTFLFNLSK